MVALSDWNDAAGASNSSPLALVDHNGNPTAATVTWTSDDVWDQPITRTSPAMHAHDERVFGQRQDGHHDSNRQRVADERERLHCVRLRAGCQQQLEQHGDLSDQRDGNHDHQCDADLQLEFQWNVHAGDREQSGRQLCGSDDSECAEFHAVGDTEYSFEWL